MMTYNTWIVLAGTSLLGACSGMVGSFAVLRRRALVGDALAHAALPGLCIAFLILEYRSLPAMLLGAFFTGLLGIATVSLLRHTTRIKEDAAIGIVLSVFYGAGIVLLRLIQNQSSAGSKAGLESYILGKTAGMIRQDVYLIAAAALFCLLLTVILYKEFKIVVFDPSFASVQGWPALSLDLLLMTMIAITVVIGLPAVGVVLMAALLIIPAAAARFWTDQLEKMLALSAGFGLAIGILGTLASAHYSLLPAGPVIVLCGTGVFVISLFFAPKRGVVSRLLAERRFRKKIGDQTALRVLYKLSESSMPNTRGYDFLEIFQKKTWREPELAASLMRLSRDGFVERTSDGAYRLTDAGFQRSRDITRNIRLWELYLSEYAESANSDADLDSESLRERVPRQVIEELEAKLLSADQARDIENSPGQS